MCRPLIVRRISCLLAVLFLFVISLAAQTSSPSPSPAPAAVPILQEPHHHLEVGNSYVHALFVEILPHDATLRHQHDLPFIGVNVGPAGTRISYTPGGFAHAVANPGDTPMHNIAIELLRPQGKIMNRCAEVLRGRPFEICEPMNLDMVPFYKLPEFETDELLVERWIVGRHVRSKPSKVRRNMLVVASNGVKISAGLGINSDQAPHGILWIPAHSKMVFETVADRGGDFITISFKDKAPPSSQK